MVSSDRKYHLFKRRFERLSKKEKPHEKQVLQSWTLTYTRAVRQRILRQKTAMAKMGTLLHYLYTQDTNEVARNTVFCDNESDKRAANCKHLHDASICQNDEESNDDQCDLKETSQRRILDW